MKSVSTQLVSPLPHVGSTNKGWAEREERKEPGTPQSSTTAFVGFSSHSSLGQRARLKCGDFLPLLALAQDLLEPREYQQQSARGRRGQGRKALHHMLVHQSLSERKSGPWGFTYSRALESDSVRFKSRLCHYSARWIYVSYFASSNCSLFTVKEG